MDLLFLFLVALAFSFLQECVSSRILRFMIMLFVLVLGLGIGVHTGENRCGNAVSSQSLTY